MAGLGTPSRIHVSSRTVACCILGAPVDNSIIKLSFQLMIGHQRLSPKGSRGFGYLNPKP